jgi:hypothetical protein
LNLRIKNHSQPLRPRFRQLPIEHQTQEKTEMKSESVTLQQALSIANRLSPLEKVQLIEQIIPDVEASLAENAPVSAPRPPLRSVYGLCASLGEAPTAAEIDEARQEFLNHFPREDI